VIARSTTVLSVLPVGEESRTSFTREFGSEARFLDLQRLRRLSAGVLWRTLRDVRSSVAIVFASHDEFEAFRDYLIPIVCAVPADRRELRLDREVPRPISPAGALPSSALRVLLAWCRGFVEMVGTWVEATWRLAAPPGPRRAPAAVARCLYLKPGLNFGRPVGGSVAHVAGVANALVRRACSVRVVSSQPQAMLEPAVEQVVRRADFPLALLHELNQHQYRRRFAARALEEAREAAPDFIYQRHALNDFSGARLRSRLDIPLVVEFNGSEVWVQRHWGKRLFFERAARAAERAGLRAADLVVVVSEEVGRQARDAGVDPDRILFVPNGVDAVEFDPDRFDAATRARVRERHGVPPDALLYAFVGTFGEWHGTDVFASAILSLREKSADWLREHRVHFLFVGDGPLGAEARDRLSGAVQERLVTFVGLIAHEEAPAVLAASDILVSPHKPNDDGSRFFGSPTKLFEYMAMARTIVASDLDQIGEVLRGWRPTGPEPRAPDAILVRPGDAGSLEDGLRRAAAMTSLGRAELGRGARATVLRQFTWERNVESVLDALLRGENRTRQLDIV
jgi:glycosyltransferase involved in cell wall biosynthesis